MQPEEKRVVKLWFYSSLSWLALGPLIGLFQSLQFLFPEALDFLSAVSLAYSKLRIFHTNTVIYGWIGMGFIAAILYIVPRLCDVPLRSARLAYWAGWIWNLAVALDVALIWAGIVGSPWLSIQPYEYAEAPLLVDIFIVVSAVLVITSVHATVLHRKRERLYVSVWYLLGGSTPRPSRTSWATSSCWPSTGWEIRSCTPGGSTTPWGSSSRLWGWASPII